MISPATLVISNYLPSKDHRTLPNLLTLKCHRTLLLGTEHQLFFVTQLFLPAPKFIILASNLWPGWTENRLYRPIVSFGNSPCKSIYAICHICSWSWCWCCKENACTKSEKIGNSITQLIEQASYNHFNINLIWINNLKKIRLLTSDMLLLWGAFHMIGCFHNCNVKVLPCSNNIILSVYTHTHTHPTRLHFIIP